MTNNNNEMIVIINPEEYSDFLHFLAYYGFHYHSGQIPGTKTCVLEQVYCRKFATAYTINISNRQIGYFPYFEIYQKDSPMHNDKKFNYYMQQTVTCEDAKTNIINNILYKV